MPDDFDGRSQNSDPSVPDWLHQLRRSAAGYGSSFHEQRNQPSSRPSSRDSGWSGTVNGLNEIDRICERICDCRCLEAVVYWHGQLIERLELEVLTYQASDDVLRDDIVAALRERQDAHRIVRNRLQNLIDKKDRLVWPMH